MTSQNTSAPRVRGARERRPERTGGYFFFFGAGLRDAGFLTFFAAGFFGDGFFRAAFFEAGFFTAGFFAAGFFTVGFLGAGRFEDAFFAAGFAAFFAGAG